MIKIIKENQKGQAFPLEYAIIVLVIISLIGSWTAVAFGGGVSKSEVESSLKDTRETIIESIGKEVTRTDMIDFLSGKSWNEARTVVQDAGIEVPTKAGIEVPEGPLKIGSQYFMSGAAGLYGDMAKKGIQIAVDEINANGGILGREIDVVFRDEAEGPLKNFRDLVNKEGCKLLMGVDSSGDALNLKPIIEDELKVPCIITHAATPRLFAWEKSKYTFGIRMNEEPVVNAACKMIAKMEDVNKVAFVGPDYSYGWDTYALYEAYLNKYAPGVEVLDPIYKPLGKTDFTAEIDKLKAEKPDVIASNIWGAQLPAFLKQSKQQGLWDVIDYHFNNMLTGHWELLTDEMVPEQGELWGSGRYVYNWPPHDVHPLNDRFVEKFRNRYDTRPPYVAATGYTALYAYKEAIERAAANLGEWPSSEQIAHYLEGLAVPGPMGPVHLRAKDHQGVYTAVWEQIVKEEEGEQPSGTNLQVFPAGEAYPAPLETALEKK
ncbi:hypothetical protein AKJ66_03570 [candidate division MSBL1 archaeon SCGC-AAA259E22]|uniref:Leucine-binding protein domain-containing protein n=1 Tax=candidate division MSBL1 archaeon SCGC-AAA259E22 TaxID=1698265 RepID=A0A133UF17_9EURY|nr:hypothetical protein AKJ66_03570 [candidate division MSBL1 archaeon SCGC-AAA259E22]